MRVWVVWSTHGAVTGVQDVATDETLRETVRAVGDALRDVYHVDGAFHRVLVPEPYYRHDERVYRCGGITLIARPFTVEV